MGGLSRLGGHGNQDRHAILYSIYFLNENKERVCHLNCLFYCSYTVFEQSYSQICHSISYILVPNIAAYKSTVLQKHSLSLCQSQNLSLINDEKKNHLSRVFAKISSYWVNTTSWWGINSQGFFVVLFFRLFSFESSHGQRSL